MATDPLTLLSAGKCYACFGTAGSMRVMEISLLQQWAVQSASPALDPVVTAWVARVQANGGGTPSAKSQNAINTFWKALKTAGIDSKMIHVNCIAGDNYITATTPLIVGPGGFNQWHDNNGTLAGGQLNLANGLNGNQSYVAGSFFDTGVIPSATSLAAGNAGVSVYVSEQEPDGTNHTHGGCDNFNHGGTSQFKLIYDFELVAFDNGVATGFVTSTNGGIYQPFAGFFSLNVEPTTPSWNVGAYGVTAGSPQFPTYTHLVNDGGGSTPGTGTVTTISSFGWLDVNGQFQEPSAETLSFAAFHLGLTFTQSTALFNAVQAMRVAMGAGFI